MTRLESSVTPASARRRRFLAQGASLSALAAGLPATRAQSKAAIKLGFVDGWSDSVATTNLAAAIIREKFGHPVELVAVAAGLMWQGVARGDLDAMLSAWLPVTHESYFNAAKEKVQVAGTNFKGAKIGLIVPFYVTQQTIADLNAAKADYSGRIVGIDAGAGVMRKTEEAIKAYGLELKLLSSSGPAMAAELDRAFNAKKAIAVTGWIPHWMFAKYRLRFLEDPKNVYGAEERVDTVIHPALNTKAPQVVSFLKKLSWNAKEMGSVMLDVENGAKPEAAAQKWIAQNPGRVQEWLA